MNISYLKSVQSNNKYGRILISRTVKFSKPAITRTKSCLPRLVKHYIFTRLDFSNSLIRTNFRFPWTLENTLQISSFKCFGNPSGALTFDSSYEIINLFEQTLRTYMYMYTVLVIIAYTRKSFVELV